MASKMKQMKAAKRAAQVSEDAAVRKAQMAKWARGSRCPWCSNIFDTKASLERHLTRGCPQHPDNERVRRRRKDIIDPQRAELGKVYKNSALAAYLRRLRGAKP